MYLKGSPRQYPCPFGERAWRKTDFAVDTSASCLDFSYQGDNLNFI